jgi:Spy/CpxP family protein refolding chaperone
MGILLPPNGKHPPAGGRNYACSSQRRDKKTEMTSHIAWVVAVLLLVPASGRAAGLDAICEREAQQRAAHPQAATKPDSAKPEKKADDKPGARPERPKWWIEPKLRAELQITDQQSALVEKVWQKSAPALREGREKLIKLEEVLSKLTDANDEAAVIAQSDTVEKLRAELNKGRTLMIYRMNQILTVDQRAKVKAMYEHNDQSRRGSSPR